MHDVVFLKAYCCCKTSECLGVIIVSRSGRKLQGGWADLTCNECNQKHRYSENDLCSGSIPLDRIKQLYPDLSD